MTNRLDSILKEEGFDLSEDILKELEIYKDTLQEWNEFMDLTNIIEDEDVYYKHFLDSLLIMKYFDFEDGKNVIDVGTGAGFPGLPLKIAKKDLNVTLMDSLNKRIKFLNEVIDRDKLTNIEAIHGRAEEMSRTKEYREKYDYAVSRAVARLNTLVEYTLPFVSVGGYFISMKGPQPQEEVEEAKNAIKKLGGELVDVIEYELSDTDNHRSIIIIKKVKETDKKYPRGGGKPRKKPL
ncbi:MAG: 16S rRNA (guanine(527)-N(7))-methyltransferase RsmG [Tissierellia bacterium]|nr:16S rRNA (guanine(527)-N(7))-methyltransferase RsmG [Tissierellia bacterium]